MYLTKNGITIDVVNPVEIARFKQLGYVEAKVGYPAAQATATAEAPGITQLELDVQKLAREHAEQAAEQLSRANDALEARLRVALDAMTKAELEAFAQQFGVDLSDLSLKDEFVARLSNATWQPEVTPTE